MMAFAALAVSRNSTPLSIFLPNSCRLRVELRGAVNTLAADLSMAGKPK
jgi:hypothetical protein